MLSQHIPDVLRPSFSLEWFETHLPARLHDCGSGLTACADGFAALFQRFGLPFSKRLPMVRFDDSDLAFDRSKEFVGGRRSFSAALDHRNSLRVAWH